MSSSRSTSFWTEEIVEAEVSKLLHHMSPSKESNSWRRGIIDYIQGLFNLRYHGSFKFALGGSFPIQVYLPESDLDLTMITNDSEDDELSVIMKIFSSLCGAIRDNENQNKLPFSVDDAEYKIQSIEFINARIKVIKCVINRMNLDITVNQRNALASATFIEEADRHIGQNSLLKRGIILVKAWCQHESSKYNIAGAAISGSKEGMFSSYAISVMVLYLFNLSPPVPLTPFQVLHSFLKTFSMFQFDKYVLTLDGAIPIRNGNCSFQSSEIKLRNKFKDIAARVSATLASNREPAPLSSTEHCQFRLRTCNIVDPVDTVNNLGVSVSWKNFQLVKSSLVKGLQHLDETLMIIDGTVPKTPSPTQPDPVIMSKQSSPSTVGSNSHSHCSSLFGVDTLRGSVNGIAPGLNLPITQPQKTSGFDHVDVPAPSRASVSSSPNCVPPHGARPAFQIAPSISTFSSDGRGNANSSTSKHRSVSSLGQSLFLDIFFPNCTQSYLFQGKSVAKYAVPRDTNVDSTSTPPCNDNSDIVYRSRSERSQSVSMSSPQPPYSLKGGHPARAASDSTREQTCQSHGIASIPLRSRSKSYTSSNGDSDEIVSQAIAETCLDLRGDIASMWSALKGDTVKDLRERTNNTTTVSDINMKHPDTNSLSKVFPVESTDTTNTSEVEHSMKENSPDNNNILKSIVPVGGEVASFDTMIGRNNSSPSNTEDSLEEHKRPGSEVRPSLCSGIRPLDIIPKQQNAYSLLESPMNRKVSSENNIHTLEKSQKSTSSHVCPNSGNSKTKKKKKVKDFPVTSNEKCVIDESMKRNSQIPTYSIMTIGKEDVRKTCVKAWKSQSFCLIVFSAALLFGCTSLCLFRYFDSSKNSSPEMRSAYMKAHQHQAYAKKSSDINYDDRVTGSGFGKKAQPIVSTHPVEEGVGLLSDQIIDESDERGCEGEKNQSATGEFHEVFSANDLINCVIEAKYSIYNESTFSGERSNDNVRVSSAGLNEISGIAEVWLVNGQNITLGLNSKAQETFIQHMYNTRSTLVDPSLEGMWFKDSTPLLDSNSSIYLRVSNMNKNTSGIYYFAVVKRRVRRGFTARPSVRLSMDDKFSSSSVANVNGNSMFSQDISITDTKLDSSLEIIHILASTILRLGASPSSPTREKHIVLRSGGKLYLHIEDVGSPKPTIQWFKNGVALSNERKNVLTINRVNKSHEGTYTCSLVNMAGSFTWLEATVVVKRR